MQKILFIQHAAHEGPANIGSWLKENKYDYSVNHIYKTASITDNDFDALIILGGPMGSYDEDKFTWMKSEKKFIERAVKDGKKVLGVCLGSQLLADVLGAKVYPHKHKEIGWFPITISDSPASERLFSGVPKTLDVFHWHGDTFDLPKDAELLTSNEATINQAFSYGDNVVGLQFHIEVAQNDIEDWIKASPANYLQPEKYVQRAEDMLKKQDKFEMMKKYNEKFLRNFFSR